MSVVTVGWRVMRTDPSGRPAVVARHIFTVKAAATECAELARKAGLGDAYVAEVKGVECPNDGSAPCKRRAPI
jgi:hypothetical protein